MNEKTLTFGVSGMLWNRSLVMYDVETNSLWSHIRGEAMQGRLSGAHLTMLPGEMTIWEAWRRNHPDTTVLNLPRTAKDFTAEVYRDPVRFVYGWSLGRDRYHLGVDALLREPVRNLELGGQAWLLVFDSHAVSVRLFSRRVSGRTLTFLSAGPNRLKDEETGSSWDPGAGRAIDGPLKGQRLEPRLGMLSYRQAWESFFPASQHVNE